MSNTSSEHRAESTIKSNRSNAKENLNPVERISTIHVDRAMTAVDYTTQTATITLLTMHAVPKLDEQFDIENYVYELTGELKMPFATMDALAIYYLSTRTSDGKGLLNLIQKHIRENPLTDSNNDQIRYGPTKFE